jgi:AbiV family abortive infection protein
MTSKKGKVPDRADVLFKNLFGGCIKEKSFELVSEGLSASRRNAERLLSDVQLLVEAGRLSSGWFLLTTCREEMAKSFILADACRLDLEKHHSVLRRLCQAFYDHIFKHAYMEVLEFPNIHSMNHAKEIWEIEVKRWWAAGPEDSEPGMPHSTYFDREFPLYIDYGDYDRRWMIPADFEQNVNFMEMFGETPISKTEKLIEAWRRTDSLGLCSPEVIATLNATFKKQYIGEDGTWEQLSCLYEEVAQVAASKQGISSEVFMNSPFVKWPLYHFV